jgi:hypothetical protein
MTSSLANGLRISTLFLLFSAAFITFFANFKHHIQIEGVNSEATPSTRSEKNVAASDRKSSPPQGVQRIIKAKINVSSLLIANAAKFVRLSYNELRKSKCSKARVISNIKKIQSVQESFGSNGTRQYTMEIVFDTDVVLATIEHVPNRSDAESTQNQTFFLISSAPGPCDFGVQERLAVSSAGYLLYSVVLCPLLLACKFFSTL